MVFFSINQQDFYSEVSQWSMKCLFLQVILVFSIIQFKPARYGDYIFPPWAQGVGWVIALASIIWIPFGAIHTLWVLPGSLMQVINIQHLSFILYEATASKDPAYKNPSCM